MPKLTLPQLRRRHLDDTIEILRPTLTSPETIDLIIGLLFLKYTNDTHPDGDSETPGPALIHVEPVTITKTRKET